MTTRRVGLLVLGLVGPGLAACPAPRLGLEHGDHRIVSDGVEIVYHVLGTGPLCIVHPGGPGLEWRYLRMPELERHLTLVYLEPAGTGASGALTEVPRTLVRRHAADLEAVRHALGVDRIFLLGHSYGGGVAMRYAIEHGEHLRGLVLYGTSAVTDAEWGKDNDAAVLGFEHTSWYAEAHAALLAPPPPPEYAHDCAKLRRLMPFYFADYETRRAELDPVIASLRCWPRAKELRKEHLDDLRPELAGVHVPTLVITGRHDWLFPPKWAQVTADALPDARVVVLEASGHFGHVEEPAAFTSAVAAFVGDVRY